MSNPNFSVYDFAMMGLTEGQLLSMRDAALTSYTTTLMNGKVVTSVAAPGITTGFQVYASPTEILKAIQYALSCINPGLYGNPMVNQTIGYTR